MKRIKKWLFLVICVNLVWPAIVYADFSFIDWSSETQYTVKVQDLLEFNNGEKKVHPLVMEESLALLLHDRDYRNSSSKNEILGSILNQALENKHLNSFFHYLLGRFRDLETEERKDYFQRALTINREQIGSESLEETLLHLYESNFQEDAWIECFLQQQTPFNPVTSWTWDFYRFPGNPFKNMNFSTCSGQEDENSITHLKGEIHLDPGSGLYKIHLEFSFQEEKSGPFTFTLSPLAKNVEIKSNTKTLNHELTDSVVSVFFPEEGSLNFEISYEITDFHKDAEIYLGQVFGFLNSHSLLLPNFHVSFSPAIDINIRTIEGFTALLPVQQGEIIEEDLLITYQNDSMNYDQLFIAYVPENHLRKRSFHHGGNTVEILTYSPVSSYGVRIENIMKRLNLSFDPILLVYLPAVDTHYLYPGLAIMNENYLRLRNDISYLHFAQAVFQSEMMKFCIQEEDIIHIAGFIENTAMKTAGLLVPEKMREYREHLQEIYYNHHETISQDPLINIFFEGSFLFNYLCRHEFSHNRALYNHLRRSSGSDFVTIVREYFQTEQRDPWEQMIQSWEKNGYLPQFTIQDPVFIIWSNLKQELRLLLTKIDITFPVSVEVKILTHDREELYRNFIIHRISSLFVFPTAREVLYVELDPRHYYLKHPDHRENYRVDITLDMYEERPASGMFR